MAKTVKAGAAKNPTTIFSRHDTPVFFQGEDGVTITPSDTETFSAGVVYVGGSGDIAVTLVSGRTLTFVGFQGGNILPVLVTQVLATGTTATDINILW